MNVSHTLKLYSSLGVVFTNCLKRKRNIIHAGAITHYLKSKSSFVENICRSLSTDSTLIKSSLDQNQVTDLFKDIDYEKITGNDEALLKKFKVILLEVEVMRQDGSKVPSSISTEKWIELLHAKSRSQRVKLLNFLFVTEKRRLNDKRKKEEKKKKLAIEREAKDKEVAENNHIHYGFGGSTIFIRVYPTYIDKFFNQRVISSMQFNQKIVLDLSYDKYMTPKESSLCVKQLSTLIAGNRTASEPYNIYFCNADPESKVMTKLSKVIPTVYDEEFPVNISEKSYLDLFPKERLVYLTPHCREELLTYDHDDIYIIGAMVDKINCDPISLSIAKREGLRMAKLPLDRYLQWFSGTKSLTVNQVFSILMDIKATGDWEKALEHVPKRKLFQTGRQHKLTRGPELYRQKIRQLFK